MSAESDYVDALLAHGLVVDVDRKLLAEALAANDPLCDLETNVRVETALRLGGVTDGKRWRLILPPDKATLEAIRDWLWSRAVHALGDLLPEPRAFRNARAIEAAAEAAGIRLGPRGPLTIRRRGARGGFRNFGYSELSDGHSGRHSEAEFEAVGQPNGILGQQYSETIVIPLQDEDASRLGLPVPSHLEIGICPVCGEAERTNTIIGRADDVGPVWPFQVMDGCPASCRSHRHSWTRVKAPILRDPAARDSERTVGTVSLDVCLVPVSHSKTKDGYVFTHACGAGRNIEVRASKDASTKQWLPKRIAPGPYADDPGHIHVWRQTSADGSQMSGSGMGLQCLTCDAYGEYR